MCRKYESLTHGFNDDAPAGSGGSAAAAGSAAAYDLSDGPSYDPSDDVLDHDPDSYVPDDFEPDLDPYDRQALYDEEVVDDWVIAGGGDPFDFDDRMDAFADPFGFDGDGDPVD